MAHLGQQQIPAVDPAAVPAAQLALEQAQAANPLVQADVDNAQQVLLVAVADAAEANNMALAAANEAAAQLPALGEDSTLEDALGALAVGLRLVSADGVHAVVRAAVTNTANAAGGVVHRHRTNVQNARKVRPLTDLPVFPPDQNRTDDIENIRIPGLEVFKGTANKQTCLSWLSRIMSTARQAALTDNAIILLMKAKSQDEAFDSIEQDLRERQGLEEIVITLERKFAGVVLPDQARAKCNNMRREGSEMLSVLGNRINKMARIATRGILDNAERNRQTQELTINNLKRNLPSQTKHDLEERISVRRSQGLPEFSMSAFMAECDAIEQRRAERLSTFHDEYKRKKRAKFGVRAVAYEGLENEPEVNELIQPRRLGDLDEEPLLEEDPDSADSEDGEDSEDTEDDEDDDDPIDEDEIQVILNAVRNARHRGFKGKKSGKFIKGALKKVVDRRRGVHPPYRPPPGPPKALEHCKVNRGDLPRLAQVDQGECLHCGIKTNPPHRSKDMRCPLRGQKMVDRACLKCHKGLHQAHQCPTLRLSKN